MEIRSGDEPGSATTSATLETSRIFVGGLGESVSADDLRRTFGSLGRVEGVEIVRTKGRSFAYIDFFPSSPKSLPKLFSTYNGCAWKGGRLRLEKAKEDYLLRLRREWKEDAQAKTCEPSNGTGADKCTASLKKPKKVGDKEKLHMFFPRLKKVKALPLSGTGKHKYSFQRIEVPPLPINFCECEEHSVPFRAQRGNDFCDSKAQSGGMDEKELNMVMSVMDRVFERKTDSKEARTEERRSPVENNESDENEENDECNLIMNIVKGGNEPTVWSRNGEGKKIPEYQELGKRELPMSENEPTGKRDDRKREVGPPKKRKLQNHDEVITSKTLPRESDALVTDLHRGHKLGSRRSQKPSWRELVSKNGSGKNTFSLSQVLLNNAEVEKHRSSSPDLEKHVEIFPSDSDITVNKPIEEQNPRPGNRNILCSDDIEGKKIVEEKLKSEGESSSLSKQQLEKVREAQPAKSDTVSEKSTRGATWLQKSSWMQLVGGKDNSTFSITQILPPSEHLPNLSREKEDPPVTLKNCSNVASLDNTNQNDAPDMEATLTVKEREEGSGPPLTGKGSQQMSKKAASLPDSVFGDTCFFMRSAESVREWLKTKAALSGDMKKKKKSTKR